MEFHNPQLLPPGLCEIMVGLVPQHIYPHTRVIAYAGRAKRNHGVVLGEARWDGLTNSYLVWLYPVEIVEHAAAVVYGRRPSLPFGSVCRVRRIRSSPELCLKCQLWADFVAVALHETGHIATMETSQHPQRVPKTTLQEEYLHQELLADYWMWDAIDRLQRVHPRIGQPTRALANVVGNWFYKHLAPLVLYDTGPRRWEFVDSNWELGRREDEDQVPPEQLLLY